MSSHNDHPYIPENFEPQSWEMPPTSAVEVTHGHQSDGRPIDVQDMSHDTPVLVRRADSNFRAIELPAGRALTEAGEPLADAEEGGHQTIGGGQAVKFGGKIVGFSEPPAHSPNFELPDER